MKTYTIKHSSIAAAITVTDDFGNQWDCCYLAKNKPVQVGVAGNDAHREGLFMALPESVRAAVNKQYAAVFSVPIEQRGEFVKVQTAAQVQA